MLYPHLLPGEREVWHRFISNPPVAFSRLEYDVHLGEGAALDPAWPPEIVKLTQTVTRKRVDVIGHLPDSIWIIEVKPRAGMSAIGQLLTYSLLYQKEFSPALPLRRVIVCERLENDVRDALDFYKIAVWIV